MVINNGYILVKDKDGVLKYYKDGQFFDIDKINQTNQKTAKPIVQTPIKKIEKPEKEEVKPVDIKKQDKSNTKSDFDFDAIKIDQGLVEKRNQEQKMIEEKIDYVVNKLKISFSDKNIERRFINILTTYFRGIRGAKEIAYMLGLPKSSGGIELDENKIKLILAVLAEAVNMVDKERRQISKDRPMIQPDHMLAPPPPAIVQKEEVKPKPIDEPVKMPVEKLIEKPTEQTPAIDNKKRQDVINKLIGDEAGAYDPIKELAKKKPVMPSKPVKPLETKPQMETIQARPRITGPIEELQYMNVTDFLKLGRSLQESVEEVLERIDLLADQSYSQKIKGIKAWRMSPVFKLYLEMTMQGIKNKESIKKVIEDRQKNNLDVLTLSQFEAVANLNGKLSFA